MADVVTARALTLIAGLAMLGPPLTVGAIGAGLPEAGAWLVPFVLAAVAFWSGRVLPLPLDEARRHPVVAALWLIAFAIAVTFSIRTSLYAHYPDAPRFSVSPGDRFREEHLCMTAYAEAARLVGEPGVNVYDPELYRPRGVPRRLGRFTVDLYHYPPPFLLLPASLRVIAPDFFDYRRVWFGLQSAAVMALWIGIAWWIGGVTGRRFALGGVLLMAMPVTWAAIQVGNVQTTMIAVSLAGAMAVASGRAAGAALLTAAALGKIFPGVLLVHVLAWRRPRTIAWSVLTGATMIALTLASFGTGVFHSFFFGELPRMLSGDSFLQSETSWAAPVNQSIYGFTVKLRYLGLTVLDREAGKMVTRALVALLGVAVVAVGWRIAGPAPGNRDSRLPLLLVMFGFLNLASFISPFVGGAYGAVFTIWLAVLAALSTLPSPARAGFAAAGALLFTANAMAAVPRQGVAPSTTVLIAATVGSVVSLGVNICAVWLGSRALSRLPRATALDVDALATPPHGAASVGAS